MKVSENQQNARKWSQSLKRLNESRSGQVQIAYENEQGQKETGYISLLDIKVNVNDTEMTLGALLTEMLNINAVSLKIAQNVKESVGSVGSNVLIVRTDELGFVNKIETFAHGKDFVISEQPIPLDALSGYYYVKDNKLVLSDKRKLELFPDFV